MAVRFSPSLSFFSASMLRESYDHSDCRISFVHQQRVAALRNKLLNLRDKVAKAPDENRKFMAGALATLKIASSWQGKKFAR